PPEPPPPEPPWTGSCVSGVPGVQPAARTAATIPARTRMTWASLQAGGRPPKDYAECKFAYLRGRSLERPAPPRGLHATGVYARKTANVDASRAHQAPVAGGLVADCPGGGEVSALQPDTPWLA